LKRIAGPHAFVDNEQWSVVCMKEQFHVGFAAILQKKISEIEVSLF
jgi:hypothetical protein